MATTTAAPGPPSNHIPTIPPYQETNNTLPSLDDGSHDASRRHVSQSGGADERVPRGPVTAEMNFYDPPADGSKPHNFVEVPTDGTPQRNFGAVTRDVKINDLRGKESSVDIDKQAFAALQNQPRHETLDWSNDEEIEKTYYPEVEQLLLSHAPGRPYKVVIFDHTVRRQDPEAKRAPVTRAHIDQTAKSGYQRVYWHLEKEEADAVIEQGTRYRIINVWRPINGAVESFPLGFANSATVPDGDMVAVEHRYPNRLGETAAVRHNPDHEWFYWSGMDNDERLFLQCFDSHHPENRVPHTAFVDPRSTEQSKPRESIEVRALVFG